LNLKFVTLGAFVNVKSFLKASTTVFVSVLSVNSAFALPIDWSGVFGMDVNQISNTRRGNKDVPFTQPGVTRTGSQGVPGKDNGTNFQTYIFKLNPSIIVNDGVTLKGEFSSGYLRGGFAGDNSANDAAISGTSNSYFFTTPAQRSALNVNQIYMELYADTALVKIGRMSKHYGLGIIFDNGADTWDRFLTMYDGIEATMKIGNFSLTPYYARIASYGGREPLPAAAGNTSSTANGEGDVREMGLSAQYDNKNRDLLVSVLFAKRSSEPRARFYQTLDGQTGTFGPRGSTDVTVIEPFITKKWNKLTTSFEASLQTGDYGNVYGTVLGNNSAQSKINSSAFIFESKYELNPKWDVGFNAGQISGDKSGAGTKFEAAYLHPNYQIAELMFRYNYQSFNEGSRSIFDSPISNARFFKLYGNYKTDKWTFKGAFIMANAMETAKTGTRSYNHDQNYAYEALASQSDDIGKEIDFGFDYRWNPNVVLSGSYGYWMVGDYYAFSNSATKLDTSSVHGGSLRATLEF
jgi:hypothetical protein